MSCKHDNYFSIDTLFIAFIIAKHCLSCNSSIPCSKAFSCLCFTAHKSSLPPLETNKSDYPLHHKKDARGNQYHKYCSFPLRLWCFHLSMCPYQVGCNLIVNRYILKVPFSECSFIIPSEYFLSIITRLHLSHLIPMF